MLVEAAKLAPRYSHELALLREKEIQRGNKNRATLAVARKLVAYMLAVDRRKQDFVPAEELAAKAVAGNPFPNKEEQKKIIRWAGCQVLQQIARATEETPEAHFALFRDWQRTQT